MKVKFSIPERKYCAGSKKMLSVRLPEKLIKQLEDAAAKYGWTTTDLITTALDQFVQWSERK